MKKKSFEDKKKFQQYQEDIRKAKQKQERKKNIINNIQNINFFFRGINFKKFSLLFFIVFSAPIILLLFLVYGTKMILGI